MIRLLLFIPVILSAVVGPPILFAGVAIFYALRYTAYELIVLSGMVDAFYSYEYGFVPYYTILTIISLLIIEYLKPRLSLYNQ